MIKKSTAFLLLWLSLFCVKNTVADYTEFIGASGVVRKGDELLIVSDKDPGAYYRYPLANNRGPLITIDSSQLVRVPMPGASLAMDLESIEILADGRVVGLSEQLSALVSEKGVVAEYGGPFSELAGIGTEGVAVRPLEDGSSRVAILWEGGYPEFEKLPIQLRGIIAQGALMPVFLVHDILNGQNYGKIRFNLVNQVRLQVPTPKGKGPSAQRFRASDLVWHKWKNQGKEEWGFIVLLNSKNLARPPQYMYDELLRFDLKGHPVGKMLDLNTLFPKELQHLNWEGLGWFEEGESLVLVFDNSADQAPAAFVVKLPEDWK